ncbi:MAG: trigger factor [Aphanocapsa lilacina HA4352-LM1]|jgi:trigger factor|nr:trigger factor [Aphanocapsa lilacina HA4352-LM1]
MKVTQEKLPRSQMGLNVEVEGEKSKQAYEKLVRDTMRTARIPGFRPGKAPRQLVLQFYGKERLRAQALENLIDSSLKEAIEQESIASLGNLQLRDSFEELLGRYQPGEPLSFKAAVDVQPEVQLGTYTGLTVRYSEVPYEAKQVDDLLEQYREQRAVLVPVEGRAAEVGDTAVIDFAGTKAADGSEIVGGKATDFEVELLPGRLIAGFTEGIIGMHIGESTELALRFPDDYPQQELAAIDAKFAVTLKDLKIKELPVLDDDFAGDISEFETLEALRAFLEQQQREQAAEKTRANRDAAIIKALVTETTVDLPETLVNREVQFLAEQSFRNLQQQGIDPSRIFTEENMPRVRETLRVDAENRLKRTLALAQVARAENIVVEEGQVAARIAELRSELEEEVSEQALAEFAREEMLTEKILEWLAEHSTIELTLPGEAIEPGSGEDAPPEVAAGATEPEAQPNS